MIATDVGTMFQEGKRIDNRAIEVTDDTDKAGGVKPCGWGALRGETRVRQSAFSEMGRSVVCVAVGVVVAAPGVAAASTVNGSITMIGAQGDYISGGSQYLFDAPARA